MNQIKFFKHSTKTGVYYDRGRFNGVLDKLALFLSTEITCFGSAAWIKFFKFAEEEDETSGNLMTLEKRGSNVLIGNVYCDGPEDEQEYFVISISELEKLMKKWEKLMKEQPDEITLSMQDGRFDLVGENYFQKK